MSVHGVGRDKGAAKTNLVYVASAEPGHAVDSEPEAPVLRALLRVRH